MGPFEASGAVELAASLPDRVAFIVLEGGWTAEEVFRKFGPFGVGVPCVGTPMPDARRYVRKMLVAKIGGPVGEPLEASYKPAYAEADAVVEVPSNLL